MITLPNEEPTEKQNELDAEIKSSTQKLERYKTNATPKFLQKVISEILKNLRIYRVFIIIPGKRPVVFIKEILKEKL